MSTGLADYAVNENTSRGRKFPEKPHPYRSGFERDRDRIIHCSAFRRLEGKTQVFTPGLDDYYRTRLTHSIEVAQIGRTIAKALNLNETLTEAVCLAHDLGHPPFGHTGEDVLNDLMAGPCLRRDKPVPAKTGKGFEHNQQTLRIVELLEHPYPDFAGLNLMYETRLGLAKHITTYDRPDNKVFTEANCSLEGQAAEIADRIAYNCHDLEDAMRAQIIFTEQLRDVELFTQAQKHIKAEYIDDSTIRRTRTAKAIIDKLVSDCIAESIKAIKAAKLKKIDEIYTKKENLIVLSAQAQKQLAELEGFLFHNFYRHETIMQNADKIKAWLRKLFKSLLDKPSLMPVYYQNLAESQGLERTVCDYISGMTDRYCLNLLEKI
jgi:dGTPase